MADKIDGPYSLEGDFVYGPDGYVRETGERIGKLLVQDLNAAHARGMAHGVKRFRWAGRAILKQHPKDCFCPGCDGTNGQGIIKLRKVMEETKP